MAGANSSLIPEDIEKTALHFGTNARLLQAVVLAEGGGDAIIKAIQCSLPKITTRAAALDVSCRTINHALWDWVLTLPAAQRDEFVAFLGSRWAPLGVANDPTNLNRHWIRNVTSIWTRLLSKEAVRA